MIFVCAIICFLMVYPAQANEWIPVTGADNLKNFMGGLKAERTLPNGYISRGEYRADGTGTVFSWGDEIPRKWEIKVVDQLCITINIGSICYQIERNSDNPKLYRAIDKIS